VRIPKRKDLADARCRDRASWARDAVEAVAAGAMTTTITKKKIPGMTKIPAGRTTMTTIRVLRVPPRNKPSRSTRSRHQVVPELQI
jgi:hypothetical protein